MDFVQNLAQEDDEIFLPLRKSLIDRGIRLN